MYHFFKHTGAFPLILCFNVTQSFIPTSPTDQLPCPIWGLSVLLRFNSSCYCYIRHSHPPPKFFYFYIIVTCCCPLQDVSQLSCYCVSSCILSQSDTISTHNLRLFWNRCEVRTMALKGSTFSHDCFLQCSLPCLPSSCWARLLIQHSVFLPYHWR